MKKFLSLFIILSIFSTFILNNMVIETFAQLINPSPVYNPSASACLNLSYNQTVGSRDHNTEGEVSALQIFLNQNGLLNHVPTGYFGVLTRAAVAEYQTMNNIYPNVGYLGPITRASINNNTCNQRVPSVPETHPSYYCDQNGITYQNEQDYSKNCVSITYSFFCQSNGITYNSQSLYNQNCLNNNFPTTPNIPSNTAYFYCQINGQTYYNVSDYQNYCKSNNINQLPVCNLNNIYYSTNSCVCPSGYTFMNNNGNYKCDNGNYACTMIYVAPWATSSQYDRCHYPYYCSYDGLYHNDNSYCSSIPKSTTNYCPLNVTNQGGGFVATNDCICPNNSVKVDLGNSGEIYSWICKPVYQTYSSQ